MDQSTLCDRLGVAFFECIPSVGQAFGAEHEDLAHSPMTKLPKDAETKCLPFAMLCPQPEQLTISSGRKSDGNADSTILHRSVDLESEQDCLEVDDAIDGFEGSLLPDAEPLEHGVADRCDE